MRKEFSKELQKVIRRDKKQYYKICKDTEVGNRLRKTKKLFQKILKFRRRFQTQTGMLQIPMDR